MSKTDKIGDCTKMSTTFFYLYFHKRHSISMNQIKKLWADCPEMMVVPVVGTILSTFSCFIYVWGTNFVIQSSIDAFTNPNYSRPYEISFDAYWQVYLYSTYVTSLILCVSVVLNIFAIWVVLKNPKLYLVIRCFLTGENINRLLYTVILLANYFCNDLGRM
ncbi:unnamed protein product, partial [Mesorhabditis belari]|uniref:Uncharacterized protein n=1 Tax=Mesorhabditis belari TaxID=2138241 RepID=A0AAF3EBT1_9BILA